MKLNAVLLALLLLAAPAMAEKLPDPVAVPKWEVIPAASAITFTAKQMGTTFEGHVPKFTTDIRFSPDALDRSKAVVEIDTASIDAGDKERNEALQDKAWFDPERFPAARFETSGFTRTGDGAFLADATLTIRGVSVPVQLPFTLVKEKPDAVPEQLVMEGAVTLDRSKFRLGQGDWADPGVIANEVAVKVRLTVVAAAADTPAR